jgi:hypothetical protein
MIELWVYDFGGGAAYNVNSKGIPDSFANLSSVFDRYIKFIIFDKIPMKNNFGLAVRIFIISENEFYFLRDLSIGYNNIEKLMIKYDFTKRWIAYQLIYLEYARQSKNRESLS